MKQMFKAEKEHSNRLDVSLDRLFKRYCNGKKVTQRDRDKVGEILSRVERKTGRTLAQEVIDLRRGK